MPPDAAAAWAGGVNQFVAFLVVVLFIVVTVLFVVLFERRIIGFFQLRLGPNRVGPQGLLQTIADALKLLQKEDIMPLSADPVVYNVAPFAVFVPALMAFVVIPYGAAIAGGKYHVFIVKDLNVGVLYLLAVSSVALIGFIMAGWGSNNKYALISAVRNAAQIISYEVPMVVALIGVVMTAGSTSLVDIVHSQTLIWNLIPQFAGFLIYLICGVAETNRSPFDLPEAESELVAGFHIEYSGMKFALFFLAEYTNVFVVSAIVTTCFLGGWKGPMFLGYGGLWFTSLFWFFLKTYLMVFVFIWLRATLPRFRVDQLMGFAWKFLVPVSILHMTIVGLGMVYQHPWYLGSSVISSHSISAEHSIGTSVRTVGETAVEEPGFRPFQVKELEGPGVLKWAWYLEAYDALPYSGKLFFVIYSIFVLLFAWGIIYTLIKVKRGIKRSIALEAQWRASSGGEHPAHV
ncbi:MAG: NADH-quinone oxidoreductase subunit NuoH [bacterium]